MQLSSQYYRQITLSAAALALMFSLSGCDLGPGGNAPPATPGFSAEPRSAPASHDVVLENVSAEDAIHAVLTEYGGKVVSVKSETFEGEDVWAVKVDGSSKGKITADVNKTTGEIVFVDLSKSTG